MVLHLIPAPGRQRQVISDFKDNLVFIVSCIQDSQGYLERPCLKQVDPKAVLLTVDSQLLIGAKSGVLSSVLCNSNYT